MESIKSIREQHNLTRKDFCELLNIPYRTLQDWETGRRQCPEYLVSLIEHRLQTK